MIAEIDLREGDECCIELQGNPNEVAGDPMLVLSGSELAPDRLEQTGDRLCVAWAWTVDFYAGEVSVEILVRSHVLWHGVLDVRPHAHKLGKDAFAELVADLQARIESVVFGSTPAERAVAPSDGAFPPIARLAMLRVHAAEIERCFTGISERPSRRLVARREQRPLDQARRIDPRSIRAIIRSPSVLSALGYSGSDVEVMERPRVDHPRREHTYDTAANRHVNALLHRLSCTCRDLRSSLLAMVAGVEPGSADQARAQGLHDETARLQRRVEKMARAPFLSDVPRVLGNTAALISVAKEPTYSRFDWLVRRALSPRLTLGSDALREKLWLRRTYELYEYWCFFRIADALIEHMPLVEPRFAVRTAEANLLLGIGDGCFLEGSFQGARVCLTFQQTFPSYALDREAGDGPYSISGERRPDMVLSVQKDDLAVWAVLDAKYRSSRGGIHAALGDMHVYRDALRNKCGGLRPAAAFIITPNHDADGAGVYYTDDYRRKYGLGGFDLSPGNDHQAEALVSFLRSSLAGRSSRDYGQAHTAPGRLGDLADEMRTGRDEELTGEFIKVVREPTGIRILAMTVAWSGPHTPEVHWRVGRRLAVQAADTEIRSAIEATLEDERFFQVCEHCGRRTPVGCMHSDSVCQSCAERDLGIIH